MPENGTEIKELRGVEVVNCYGRACYVVHVDREVGITIHDMEKDKPAGCLNKEEFVRFLSRELTTWEAIKIYNDTFDRIVAAIRKGKTENFLLSDNGEIEWTTENYRQPFMQRGTCAFKK